MLCERSLAARPPPNAPWAISRHSKRGEGPGNSLRICRTRARKSWRLLRGPRRTNLSGSCSASTSSSQASTAEFSTARPPSPSNCIATRAVSPRRWIFRLHCNLFWLLDDFTPARGGTWVVPGSHRWPAEYQVMPPPREMAVQIEAPAGGIFLFDGRVWHGAGVNTEGHTRRHISMLFCLPWVRQQENWGVSCLQEVLDEASPKLKVRLGPKVLRHARHCQRHEIPTSVEGKELRQHRCRFSRVHHRRGRYAASVAAREPWVGAHSSGRGVRTTVLCPTRRPWNNHRHHGACTFGCGVASLNATHGVLDCATPPQPRRARDRDGTVCDEP